MNKQFLVKGADIAPVPTSLLKAESFQITLHSSLCGFAIAAGGQAHVAFHMTLCWFILIPLLQAPPADH